MIPLNKGDVLIALKQQPYFFGQGENDCIEEGEEVTVEDLLPDNMLQFIEVPARYSNFSVQDFKLKHPQPRYAIILNFETGKVESLSLENQPLGMEDEDYIEEDLDYSLSNTQWMVVSTPIIHPLNY